VSARGVLRAWRPRRPQQASGDPCEACGTVLVPSVQCGVNSRCLTCYPYERSSARDAEIDATVRLARDQPRVGLLAGLGAGASWGSLLLSGEVPHCRGHERTLHDRRALAGGVALLAQLALTCTGIATA
jgi:hypothetical protein